MQTLNCGMHEGYSSLTRDQTLGPLHWDCGVLPIRPPGKSQDLLSQQLSFITYSNVNYIYHVVHYISSTYSPYNWKFIHFDFLSPIPPPPNSASGNNKPTSFSVSWLVSLFLKYN